MRLSEFRAFLTPALQMRDSGLSLCSDSASHTQRLQRTMRRGQTGHTEPEVALATDRHSTAQRSTALPCSYHRLSHSRSVSTSASARSLVAVSSQGAALAFSFHSDSTSP